MNDICLEYEGDDGDMANYLDLLGFGSIATDEEQFQNFLLYVLDNGDPITNYYGFPYINYHFGDIQIVCRSGRSQEANRLEFRGIDTHADSLCAWKMRIEQKLVNENADDPTRVRLLTKGMDGSGLFTIDVVNGDVLPSFKKDEVIDLQMIAFAGQFTFYADEEDYERSVEPGINGTKTMIGENTIFPIGLFSENNKIKDIVQIHGVIQKLQWGVCNIDDQKFESYLRCTVKTQLGDIVIALSLDDMKDNTSKQKLRKGGIIDCYARLSGDAAIYAYEKGLVKDAENNLRLVAYTLEEGDPERLRSVLAKNFFYHSDNGQKHITDMDEFINFVNIVHRDGAAAHLDYATIESIEEGTDMLKYPVGTRCAVISYEGQAGYDAIVFVDTTESGEISCIYLSRESRYHFRADQPLPDGPDVDELLSDATYQTAICSRAHFYNLVDNSIGVEVIEAYIAEHWAELLNDLADLFNQEMSEEVFVQAYLRGLNQNPAAKINSEEVAKLGKMFYKDATFCKKENEQDAPFNDALMFVYAVGCFQRGNLNC